MVKAAREAPGASAIRPLRTPVPVRVETDREGQPRAIGGRARFHIIEVEDRWRIDDEWWGEKPVSRLYYRVLLEDGRHITIFHDLISNRWYEQDYA